MNGMWLKLGQHTVVAAAIRQAVIQPDHPSATQTWTHVADQLRPRFGKFARPHGSLGSVPNPLPMSKFSILFASARFEGGTGGDRCDCEGQDTIKGETRGDRGRTTAWGCHPCPTC